MFEAVLAEYLSWGAAALHAEIERLELEARALDARRLAVRAVAEALQVPAMDGHKSMRAYLRATCNQPSHVALSEIRQARTCRDFPQIGEALIQGRIGVGQIDELVRIQRNRARRDIWMVRQSTCWSTMPSTCQCAASPLSSSAG